MSIQTPPNIVNKRWIAVFIIAFLIATVISVWNSNKSLSPKILADSGLFDLRTNSVHRESIPLDGEWKFVWGQLLAPSAFPKEDLAIMSLPTIWNGIAYEQMKLPAHGHATFQLKVIVDPNAQKKDLALYIPFIHSSYSLYLGDEKIADAGRVGTSLEDYMPSARTNIVPLRQISDTLLLTLQVANYAYSMGGIWQSPRIGTLAAVRTYYDRQLAFDLFIFGGLLLMGIYHIALFFLRRRIKSNLYFGLMCLFLGLKNLFTGTVFFYTIMPDISYEMCLKIIHITIYVPALMFWLFLRESFRDEFPLLVSKILFGLIAFGVLATLLFPSYIYSQLTMPFLILMAINMIVILRGIYLAVRHNREGSLLIVAGVICFLFTVLHDIAIDLNLIQSVYLAGAGFFILIFSQALILAVKFTNSFQHVENLTENLMNTNRSINRFVPSEVLSFLKKESIMDIKLSDNFQGNMTVFFSDIRSYTTLSERMSPQTNFDFINDYLGRVVRFIDENNGVVNQYLGDGILALFMNRPEDAIKAAIQIQYDVAQMRNLGGYQLEQKLENGIGIHSGPIILGMLGTEQRMSPGVISDTVNTSSRIEGLTKIFGAPIIISEDSMMMIEDKSAFEFRFLGKIQVKGKKNALKIHEVLDGLPLDERKVKSATRADFQFGLNRYFEKDFQASIEQFRKVLIINPNDIAAQLYLKNSMEYAEEKLAKDWEGTLKMEIK